MSDVFMDQVRSLHDTHTTSTMLIVPLPQGPVAAAEPWSLFDLWQKDSLGNWGKPVGTAQGKIAGVNIGPHQTKVWRAEPPVNKAKRTEL